MRLLFCNPGMAMVREAIAAALPEHDITYCEPHAVAEHLLGVDIVVPTMTRIDAALIAQGQFGFIQQVGVGLEGVDIACATRHGVLVARMPARGTGNAESVAEHTIMLMLLLARRFPQSQQALQQRGLFAPRGDVLCGKRACIVGLGSIGTEVAHRLTAFGMELTAVRAHPARGVPDGCRIEHLYGADDLHTAVANADYVLVTVNHTPATHHLFNAATFAAMQPGAYLVNVARGGLIDHAALLVALQSGHIAGAGLDVFWEEPVDPQHPLFGENVIATPHIAGVTDLFVEGIVAHFVGNIRAYARGDMPLHTVNAPPTIRNRPSV